MAEVIVETPAGRYRGVRVGAVSSFLGLRYGVATGPEGRFRPARPAPAHAGVRDALHYGHAAIQRDARLDADPDNLTATRLYFPRGGATEGVPTSEDCLTLDVWTPTTDPEARLPVLVWFHGGAFRAGSSAATVAAGDELARTGRAVVVTVNHRLGLLGFTALGDLLGPEYAASGSAGLSDMILALEWVRDSIAAFGGDSSAVTVFGQSGGGTKVAALLRMPRATGLFRRCIAQSPGGLFLDREAGQRQTDDLLRALGLNRTQAARLLDLPADAFIEAQRMVPGVGPSPVVDGVELLAQDDPALPRLAAGIDLLTGATSHEWSLMLAGAPWYTDLDDAGVTPMLRRLAPSLPDPDAVVAGSLARFPGEDAQLRLCRILSERSFGLIAERLARGHIGSGRVFRYEIVYETDAEPGPLGATHCIDVPCVFGTVRWTPLLGDRAERWDLQRDMMAAWLAFAEGGRPVLPCGQHWPEAGPDAAGTVLIDAHEWTIEERRSAVGHDAVPLF